MRIYTSYFGRLTMLDNRRIWPISIARWPPKWYDRAEMKTVAPTAYMVKGDITREQYVKMYKDILSRLRVEDVIADINRLSFGHDVALLCWEKPEDFCHRHLLADWILNESGVLVEEFEPGGAKRKSEAQARPKPEAEQELKLF